MDQSETQLTSRGAATRTRIVDAAANLVRRNGAAGTSLEAVMLAGGVSKSQLYHYFADKEALITAVVERQTESVLAVNGPLLKTVDSIDGLRHWRDVLLDGSTADGPGGCPLGSLVGELAGRPRQQAALADGFARWQSYLRDGFVRMRERGELPPTAPADDLAVACLAALQGGLLLAQAEGTLRPLRLALDMAIAQVSAAAKPEP